MNREAEIAELAQAIYLKWMRDKRWTLAHIHPPQAPQDYPIAYFWAELAARAALEK